MEKIVTGILMMMLASVLFIAIPIISAFFAGVGAWAAGLVFEDTIRQGMTALGLNMDNLSMFQIGVVFGFLGSFIRAVLSSSTSSKD